VIFSLIPNPRTGDGVQTHHPNRLVCQPIALVIVVWKAIPANRHLFRSTAIKIRHGSTSRPVESVYADNRFTSKAAALLWL
jgi:hypothetical protein